jgi:sulfur relay (sulfurtransferase) DsrC/TusE family protein
MVGKSLNSVPNGFFDFKKWGRELKNTITAQSRKRMTEQQREIIKLMRELLGDQYTHLHVKRVLIEENLEEKFTSVSCEVNDEATDEKFVIAAKGVGVIDAFFKGMVDRFAAGYPSLKTIKFLNFSIQARLDTKQGYAGTDSEGEVTLEIANSEGKNFRFIHASRSVIAAGIITTLLAMEYFINSEKAFVNIYQAMKDAQKRNRSDLVQRYTDMLAILVQNTSYSEVISKLREELY